MADSLSSYDLAAIRDLLLAAFTAEDLRRLFLYTANPELRELRSRVNLSGSPSMVVYEIVESCMRYELIPDLLREVEQANPRQYARFAPQFQVLAYRPPPPPSPGQLPEPGELPPRSRLSLSRNEVFTGRLEPLKMLAAALLYEDGPSARTPLVLQGLAGTGKTQVAVEFAYRYGRYFYGVYWLNAAQSDLLGAEVTACGEAMRLSDWPHGQPERVARTLQAWQAGGPYLIILDNLRDIDTAEAWLPRLRGDSTSPSPEGGPRLLLTTRRVGWPAALELNILSLEAYAPKESLLFLRHYLPPDRAADEDLAALARQLSHLPLALEMAGRYLARHPELTVNAYLEEMDSILTHPSMRDRKTELSGTLALSWQQVTDETAQRLFVLAGYCAPDQPIPRELLERAAGLDEEACARALSLLARLGLLEYKDPDGGVTIHPLLAEYARTLDEGRAVLPELAASLAGLAAEACESGKPDDFAALRPHVEVVAAAAETEGLEDAGSLWDSLGLYLRSIADYAGARDSLERALAALEKAFGPEHPQVATSINNLGKVLRDVGDLQEAKSAFERALAIDERALGAKDPNVARDVNNLGRVLRGMGDLDGARAAFERALAIDEEALGDQHPYVAGDVNNLGLVLHDQGDLYGARKAFERALAIDEKHYGPEHPRVARDVNNLGRVLQDQGDLEEARASFQRALEIDEQTYGEQHPNVARDVNNLGLVLRAIGNLNGAQDAFERALAIYDRALGPAHPTVATVINNLGLVLLDLEDQESARDAFERALVIDEKALGEQHPSVARDVNNLGLALQALGDFEGIRAAFERALAIDEAVYGADHAKVAVRAARLGLLLHDMGDLKGARASLERALSIDEAVHGPQHSLVASGTNNLGLVLHDLGDLAGAEAAFRRALSICQDLHGPEHSRLTTATNNLGLVLHDLGDLAGAEDAIRRAVAIDEKAYGPEHFGVVLKANNLGMVLQARGNQEEGEAALARARDIVERDRALAYMVERDYSEEVAADADAVPKFDSAEAAIVANNLGRVWYALRDLHEKPVLFERFAPPEDLVQACLDGSCVLFASPGLSEPAGFPGGMEFVESLLTWSVGQRIIDERTAASLRQIVETGDPQFALDSIVNTLQRRKRESKLNDFLSQSFLDPQPPLPETHRFIPEIGFSAVLTTNYDQLLERALEKPDSVYTPHDADLLLKAFSSREFFLLKLRGRLDRPDTVLLAPFQYDDYLEDNRSFAQLMSSLFVSRTMLFMGASLDHLLAYVEGIRYRGSGRRHFALVPVSGDAWEPKADQLSGSYNIEVLAYRAGQPARELAFMRALARHLETRAGKSEMVEPELQQAQLAQLRLVNIGPFQDLTLDLDETWSILLGDNGVGKSTILKAIALAICGEDARQFAGRLLTFGRGSGQIELVTARGERYITNLKSTTVETEVTCLPQRPLEIEGWLALGFPPLRGMSWQQPGGPQLGQETRQGPNPADLLPLMTGAADPRIVELKQWVVNLDYRALKEGDPKSQRLFDDFGQVIDRLTVGMKLEDIQVAPKTFEITVKVDGVRVPVEMLSQGTQSLIGWVGVLLERLYEFYDEVDKPREEYALVLMDEIDAHMHPEWQQTLIPSLKALFPNAQFIVTTHSPLIPISSAPEEVYRLRRDERTQGQVAVEKLEIDLRRWRADQVLTSSLFDLDSTMAPEVYKALSRYTELSAQDELTEEDLAELERHAAMLQVRLPTPMERREARQAYERIEECLDAQLAAISAKERKKLLDEVKVQLQENITGSRRPQ